jgi:hypothetical protein
MRGYGGDVSDQVEKVKAVPADKVALERRIKDAGDPNAQDVPDAGKLSKADAARVERFQQKFGDKEGTDHVALDATQGNACDRMGALHQMDVAEELGSQVRRFEEPIHPLNNGERGRNPDKVDIATKDDYAIECKSTSYPETYASQLSQDALEQAEKRLCPNAEGKTYKGAVVVFEDGKLGAKMRAKADALEAQNPGLRFCEKSEVRRVLKEMRLEKQ